MSNETKKEFKFELSKDKYPLFVIVENGNLSNTSIEALEEFIASEDKNRIILLEGENYPDPNHAFRIKVESPHATQLKELTQELFESKKKLNNLRNAHLDQYKQLMVFRNKEMSASLPEQTNVSNEPSLTMAIGSPQKGFNVEELKSIETFIRENDNAFTKTDDGFNGLLQIKITRLINKAG